MKRRGALGAVVVALAITAAACGNGGSSSAAVSIKTLKAAASNSQAADSSRFVMSLSLDAPGGPVTIKIDGAMTADGKTGVLNMDVPTVGSLEVRTIDGVMYMNLGAIAGGKLGDRPWVKIDPAALKGQYGGAFDDLADQAQSNGPQQGLEYLQGLSGDVTKVGDDTVAGEHATHYQATIDYSTVLDKLPNATEAQRDALSKLGKVPTDVWIDDNDRVVKMKMEIDASAFGAGAGTAEMTMEITDFGVPVDVQAPPADETTDFSALTSLDA